MPSVRTIGEGSDEPVMKTISIKLIAAMALTILVGRAPGNYPPASVYGPGPFGYLPVGSGYPGSPVSPGGAAPACQGWPPPPELMQAYAVMSATQNSHLLQTQGTRWEQTPLPPPLPPPVGPGVPQQGQPYSPMVMRAAYPPPIPTT